MFLQKTVMVRAHYKTREWYTKKGYDVPKKQRQFFEVNVCDLHPSSSTIIKCKCDYCGREFERMFCKISEGKHSCKKCSGEKRKEYCREHFGVDYVFQIPKIVKQIQNTQREHRKSEEYCNSVWEKRKETFAKNHDGYETPFHIPEVVKKAQDTREELYGHKSYFGMIDNEKRHELQCKIAKTFYENQTKQTSDEQIYLAGLFHGVINYNIEQYNVDIALLDKHIVIEFDGGGHDLSVTMGHVTREEFIEYELKREDVIFNYGFKLIRIVSPHDYLPEGEILLKLVNYCKDFKRSVIDLENNYVIINNKQIQFKEIL